MVSLRAYRAVVFCRKSYKLVWPAVVLNRSSLSERMPNGTVSRRAWTARGFSPPSPGRG